MEITRDRIQSDLKKRNNMLKTLGNRMLMCKL